MKKYKLLIHERVFDQISDIQEYVASVGTYIAAVNYSNRLFDEIESITYLADAISYTQWQVAKRYHPKAKRLITHNKKWNIIFHTDGNYVIVDCIIPSSLIKK